METFQLDPDLIFLNHGSFGAPPASVSAAAERLRQEMEADPVEFLAFRLLDRLKDTLLELAPAFGASPEDLVFCRNATSAVAAVLSSFPLAPGDQILTTNHRYGAVNVALRWWAERAGAEVVEAAVPYPLESPTQIHDAVARAFTPRTRLLVVDQISSPTALVFPVETLVALARDRGVPILVDGAHAPGHLPLDLDALNPDFWTGNLHKWAFALRGTALLRVAKPWADRVRPTVPSHQFHDSLQEAFHWTGTDDPCPWLSAPAGLAAHRALGGEALMAANHRLVAEGRQVLAEALGLPLPHPDDPALYGAMASLPLETARNDREAASALRAALRARHGIQVPIHPFAGRLLVRISGQAYNRPAHYEALAVALRALLG